MRTRHLILLVAILTASALAGIGAYSLNGPKWGTNQVQYYINPANADVSENAAEAAIQAGLATWGTQSNSPFSYYYMGRTSGTSAQNNGKNEVFFRNTSNGGAVATTYWWYDGSNRLTDADIIFWDGAYTFFTGSSGCSSGAYIEDVAAHESGHALGLGHSSVGTATMYASMSWCSTAMRTLDSDDLAGLEKLYPPTGGSTNTAPSVTINSPANNSSFAEGTAITFSGSAFDKEDGDISSKITWTSSFHGLLGTGASLTTVIATTTHTITAKVTDSSGATASAQITVTVIKTATNTAPSVSITAPANSSSFPAGTAITFRGSASDKEDGDVSSKITWTSSFHGLLGTGASLTTLIATTTHTITAQVTDSSGAPASAKITVTVTSSSPAPPPPSTSLSLSVSGYKVKGSQHVDLRWTGATSASVDVYRDGVRVMTTPNDGLETDRLNRKGGGSYSYRVCEAGTSTCSNTATVTF